MRGDGRIYRRPRSPFWWAEYWAHGKRHQRSTGERTERKARAWLRTVVAKARTSAAPAPDSDTLTVARLIKFREDHYRDTGRKSAKSSLAPLLNIIRRELGEETRALALTERRLDTFFDDLTERYSQSTVRQVSLHLRAAFEKAIERGEFSRKDMPEIRKVAQPRNARQRAPGMQEIAAFAEASPEWLADYVWFSFFSGWRSSEVRGLRWKDIDAENIIRLEDSKTGQRALPIAGALLHIINKRRSGNVRSIAGSLAYIFSRDPKGRKLVNIRAAWADALTASGVAKFTPHDLRRSAAKHRRQTQGIDAERVQRIFGWSSGDMLQRYNVVDTENLRSVFEDDCIPVQEPLHQPYTEESGDA